MTTSTSPTAPAEPAVFSRSYFWPGVLLISAVEISLVALPFMDVPWWTTQRRIFLFGFGVALTSFLAAYLIATFRYARREEAVVRQRTAELAEANRRLTELARLKDEFVALVSHELRTPMAVTKEGVCQLLDGLCGPISQEQRETLQVTLRNVDRLKALIEDLLDISKIEAGRMPITKRPFDLLELLEETSRTFAQRIQEKGLKFQTRSSVRPARLNADRDRIAQVLVYLLGNAIKFTEKGGVKVWVAEQDGQILCSVSDTGPGIAPENLSKLFQKFQQFQRAGKNGEMGTGMGLAICKGIVELHGGRIWAESRLGRGTKISFSLPKGGESGSWAGDGSRPGLLCSKSCWPLFFWWEGFRRWRWRSIWRCWLPQIPRASSGLWPSARHRWNRS